MVVNVLVHFCPVTVHLEHILVLLPSKADLILDDLHGKTQTIALCTKLLLRDHMAASGAIVLSLLCSLACLSVDGDKKV